VLIAAALGGRAFALFVLVPPLERMGLTQRIDLNYKLALIWGGLRGALTLILASRALRLSTIEGIFHVARLCRPWLIFA
jgi:CPA1 family monovalent cation:H+ antiporter